eukprot:COSAG02_NODE_193_length_29843_cov_30.519903_10_plen_77_part_00
MAVRRSMGRQHLDGAATSVSAAVYSEILCLLTINQHPVAKQQLTARTRAHRSRYLLLSRLMPSMRMVESSPADKQN